MILGGSQFTTVTTNSRMKTPSSELFKREMRGRNTEQELYDRAEAALEQIMKLSRGVQSKSVSLVMELARRLDS